MLERFVDFPACVRGNTARLETRRMLRQWISCLELDRAADTQKAQTLPHVIRYHGLCSS